MGIPVNIESLLNDQVVESTRIEFKEDFNPDPIIRTICAFANDIDNIGGGYIIVGVQEKDGVPQFPVKGIEHERIDGIQKKLLNYCNKIEPRYVPVVEPVQYQGKTILVIWVKGGNGRPYKAPKEVVSPHSEKYWYIRKLANTIQAKDHELQELFSISERIPYDDQINPHASVSDLNPLLIQQFLKEINSSKANETSSQPLEKLAIDLQLVSGPPEDRHPVNAALLFFSDHPEQFFRYAYIDAVVLPDPTGENMIEKRFSGPLQTQLRQALLWIQSLVIEEKVQKIAGKAEAVRNYNYPFEAIEEILANAIYHKSYQIPEPITIRVTPTSIEITSHPGFDKSIKDEDVQKYEIRSRLYRNRRIGDFLKELRLIEGRNTGFPTAMRALERNGSGPLKFDYDDERQYLSVIIPIHSSFISTKATKQEAYVSKILEILSDGPLSLTELAEKMGYKSITAKLRRTVDQLISTRQIQYVSTYGGRSKISKV